MIISLVCVCVCDEPTAVSTEPMQLYTDDMAFVICKSDACVRIVGFDLLNGNYKRIGLDLIITSTSV